MSAKPKGKVVLIDISQYQQQCKHPLSNRKLSVEPFSAQKIHRSQTRHHSLRLKPSKLFSNTSENFLNKYSFCQLGIFQNTFQSLQFVKKLKPVNPEVLISKRVSLPRLSGYQNRKTLIFDLDQTLIHCVPPFEKADICLQISDLKGFVTDFGINLRPFARECLKEASQRFEVVVFTASHKNYADAVVDFLDPDGSMVQHRLFRETCVQIGDVYVKDLRVIDRDLEEMLIIDNSMHSYAYQIDNGIPVTSWESDPEDNELEKIVRIFPLIEEADDVRRVTREVFKLHQLIEKKNVKSTRSPPQKSKYVPRTLAKSK